MPSRAAAFAYVLLLISLYLKYFGLIALQGRERMRRRRFRWPEDADRWRGEVAAEAPRVERAQAALRNDGESQPLFLAASGAWIALGAHPRSAVVLCLGYLVARGLHTLWLVRPRQPHRTRAFAASQLCLALVLLDLFRLALRGVP